MTWGKLVGDEGEYEAERRVRTAGGKDDEVPAGCRLGAEFQMEA